ncbi:hypothetical protein WAK64_06305 [Bacillus spongiae]|uniref:Uncharacterized protein n=1 Tax=Bacillus spongiae TaxID=2683610 RepID=A0ABU8HBI0_9BACI
MLYIARTQRRVLGMLLAINVMSIIVSLVMNLHLSYEIFFGKLLICGVILLSFFIRYKLEIGKEKVTYQIQLIEMTIYKKIVYSNQIKQMKCKRIGWTTKGIIIQVKKGSNIRVVNFEPHTVATKLMEFANENGITVSKTKDYLILEK